MVDLNAVDYAVAAGAALVAGAVNALAGGGTLVSFPALLAIGVPAISANVTNTVALCPGYFGGAWAQRADLEPQRRRLPRLAAAGAVGGLVGSVLLVLTSEGAFEGAVPFLILLACALLAAQDPLRSALRRRRSRSDGPRASAPAAPSPTPAGAAPVARVGALAPPSPGVVGAVGVAAVYGGFFGAGLGIMLLAVLGLLLDEPLDRLNALKSALSVVINVVAAAFFVFSGHVDWRLAPLMAVASLAGGAVGGRLAGRIPPSRLRLVVVAFGLAVALKSWL